jgi:hypothetical protein
MSNASSDRPIVGPQQVRMIATAQSLMFLDGDDIEPIASDPHGRSPSRSVGNNRPMGQQQSAHDFS